MFQLPSPIIDRQYNLTLTCVLKKVWKSCFINIWLFFMYDLDLKKIIRWKITFKTLRSVFDEGNSRNAVATCWIELNKFIFAIFPPSLTNFDTLHFIVTPKLHPVYTALKLKRWRRFFPFVSTPREHLLR